jgi:hypothetical protein
MSGDHGEAVGWIAARTIEIQKTGRGMTFPFFLFLVRSNKMFLYEDWEIVTSSFRILYLYQIHNGKNETTGSKDNE